MKCKV